MKRWLTVLVWFGLAFVAPVTLVTLVAWIPPSSAANGPVADGPAVVVGRVYHIEGELLRYVPEERDWVALVRDAPFGNDDALFSGNRSVAELIVPNGTWIRIAESTQIQCVALEEDLTEMDVATGLARFYNRGARTVIKATSPFGYVFAYPGAIFDFYVGENSAEVVAVQGRVTFVHAATDARYDISAGFPSIVADQGRVSSAGGTVDSGWDQWNKDRDAYWAAKARGVGRSAAYLPASLRDESYALEENGTWEMLPYEGANRWFWRPTRVVAGWSPFTVGRWTYWYGDQCWIPAEPFGYVTHHYGNWVYVRNRWYWAPPVAVARVGSPFLNVGFFWYPGRVAWIHSGPYGGPYVGWVPLAPREPYYCYRHWGGPHTVVVNNVSVTQINLNLRNYAYATRAIVVNERHFHGVNNYVNVRSTDVHTTTIINNYRAAPVINNTVINQYSTTKQRFTYTNVPAHEKPHQIAINRIEQNERVAHQGAKKNGTVIQEQVKRLPEGRPNHDARIEAPRSANYVVPATGVNRQKSDTTFQQKEIKKGEQERSQAQPVINTDRAAPTRPSGAPHEVQPQPAQPAQSSPRPERVTPARPAATQQPAPPPPAQVQQSQTPKVIKLEGKPPAQTEQPDARWERVTPAKPPAKSDDQRASERQPAVVKPEQVTPPKPGQPAQQDAREQAKPRGRIEPIPQPAQPAQPSARPERVTPARPVATHEPPPPPVAQPQPPAASKQIKVEAVPATQPQPSAPKTERTAPAKPGDERGTQPQSAVVKHERVSPPAPTSGQPEPAQSKQTETKEQTTPAGRVEQAPETPPNQFGGRSERVTPARVGQPERFQATPTQRPQLR